MNNKEENINKIGNRALSLPMLTIAILFLMGLWGCLAIYNATAFHYSPFKYAGKQLVWLVLGICILWVTSKIPFERYERNIWWIAGTAYFFLILVLCLGVG